jgi:hypothetical protein
VLDPAVGRTTLVEAVELPVAEAQREVREYAHDQQEPQPASGQQEAHAVTITGGSGHPCGQSRHPLAGARCSTTGDPVCPAPN